MEKFYQDQVKRIDRLMKIIESDNPYKMVSGLFFDDLIIFACQSMWHLKDWILNDPRFGAKDKTTLKAEIYSSRCLLVCSDIANGSKHLFLNKPKIGGEILEDDGGLIYSEAKGVFKELIYVTCPDPNDEFYGMEIRTLLRQCRDTWEKIIDRHYLSIVDI